MCATTLSIKSDNNSCAGPLCEIARPVLYLAAGQSDGALVATRIGDLDNLGKAVSIEYFVKPALFSELSDSTVLLKHNGRDSLLTCVLQPGVSELNFRKVRDGDFSDKMDLIIGSPFAAFHKTDIMRIYNLGRRRPKIFGEGDVAFFDLAESSVNRINPEHLLVYCSADTGEKGYLNTFNHIAAQALMTSIFSEQMANYIADVHERFYMPALRSGHFTQAQLTSKTNNPVDNYVDMVNNEWGQELGKRLKRKFNISESTHWSPTLLARYLNEIHRYYESALQIKLREFEATDTVVVRFADKINRVMEHAPD